MSDATNEERVGYELRDGVAWLRFDDGKANVISSEAAASFNRALDRAEKEAGAVVICGRPGRFSAGFDLSVMGQGGAAVVEMIRAGAELALRLYGFPIPTLAAVTGHALAMGAVLLMSIDERFAADSDCKVGLNEAAIGMTLPLFARVLARERIAPTHLVRATANAEIYSPSTAIEAGFIDHVVPADQLMDSVAARAKALTQIDAPSHHAIKSALREQTLGELRESLRELA